MFIPSFLTSPECLQPSMRDVAISAMKSHIVRHTDRVVQRLQLASALHEEWKANTWLELLMIKPHCPGPAWGILGMRLMPTYPIMVLKRLYA